MAFELHEVYSYLQRRVRQQSNEICLCRYFQRHEVQNHNFQWAYILCHGSRVVHYEDVFFLQDVYRGQFVWNS